MRDLKTLLLLAAPELKLSENVPYREITTIGVGSALPLLADVNSEEELIMVLRALKKDGGSLGDADLAGIFGPTPDGRVVPEWVTRWAEESRQAAKFAR